MNKIYARQGDVAILQPITKLPENAQKLKTKVIVYGEATGHHHSLVGGDIFEKDGLMYLVMGKPGSIIHQEHDTIELNTGIYPVRRQRRYASSDMTALVID